MKLIYFFLLSVNVGLENSKWHPWLLFYFCDGAVLGFAAHTHTSLVLDLALAQPQSPCFSPRAVMRPGGGTGSVLLPQ